MYKIAALYHFIALENLPSLQAKLKSLCLENEIKGTLLLAHEGLNGTVAGPASGIATLIDRLRNELGFPKLECKYSESPTPPFNRLKVRLKKEIVTMGQPGVDPNLSVGTYVAPEDWNDLINAPDVAVIDTRNDYEVAIGTFDHAINPETKSFREFPQWWEENKDRFANQRIAMFCTGGIRCEKSTSYLKSQGVEDVYHLDGGILKYLETVPKEKSTWQGECFVFDGRVSVGHNLAIGPHQLCHGCRRPILPEDVKRKEYEAGVSCHQCFSETSESDKERFRERQKQMLLAKERKPTE